MRWSPLLCLTRLAPITGLTIFCAPASPQAPAPAPRLEQPACVIRPDSAMSRRGDTIRVALTDSVSFQWSAKPVGADRLVLRQMYETLVRRNCEGNLAPGAADKWVTADSGLTWIFTLRDSLRFWNGTRYTAADFVRGWSGSAGVDSVDAVDDRTIRIRLSQSSAQPWALSDPSLVLRAPPAATSASGWPVGTGPYRPDSTTLLQALRLVPADSSLALPIIEFWEIHASDPRDLLDRGADVMLTADPSLIDYADKRGDRSTLPLDWDQTYWLNYYPPLDSLPTVLAPLADSTGGAELRRSLSRDAVRAESRAAVPGVTRPSSCDSFEGPCPPRSALIQYAPGDRTARDLAERLVALVPGRLHWNAVATDDKRAARGAIGTIAVAPVGHQPAGSGSAIPLVDVRRHVILRRGSAIWVVDGDGVLRMPMPGTLAP